MRNEFRNLRLKQLERTLEAFSRGSEGFRAGFSTGDVGSERAIQFLSQPLEFHLRSRSGRFFCTSQSPGNCLGALALTLGLWHLRDQLRKPCHYHYDVQEDSKQTYDDQHIAIKCFEVHHPQATERTSRSPSLFTYRIAKPWRHLTPAHFTTTPESSSWSSPESGAVW